MTNHKSDSDSQEIENWERAAAKEKISLKEFKRRACNERALFILNPGTRLMAGVFDTVSALIKKEPIVEMEKYCTCGHSIHYHPAVSGTQLYGQCAKPTCDCKKFSERKLSRALGKKDERKA